MFYKVLSNLSHQDNHATRLKELISESDTVIITSPFLMMDFADFFGEADLSNLSALHLITTLPANSFDQVKKINSLISLVEFPNIQNKQISCRISINNKLHGKIYIFKRDGNYISAIISSANFTDSGLSRNHEWGIEIFDTEEITSLEQSIISTIEFPNLTFDELYRMQEATTAFLDRQPQTEIRDIDLNLVNLLTSATWVSTLSDNIDYWLKPIGVSDRPVSEDRLFDLIEDHLHFSKQRPNGVKPNDILITYGVGTTKMLSVYRATSYPIHATHDEIHDEDWLERWPWYVEATNLTPNFGATWARHNLNLGILLNDYLTLNPDEFITAVGGQTLGGLNFGKDKLRLAPPFARYIIDKIVAINDRRI